MSRIGKHPVRIPSDVEVQLSGQRLTGELDLDITRDPHRMLANARHRNTSKYAAEHLAANLCGAGLVVRHHPPRGRENSDPESIIDSGQVGNPRIDAPAGLRYSRYVADHRLTIDIFE